MTPNIVEMTPERLVLDNVVVRYERFIRAGAEAGSISFIGNLPARLTLVPDRATRGGKKWIDARAEISHGLPEHTDPPFTTDFRAGPNVAITVAEARRLPIDGPLTDPFLFIFAGHTWIARTNFEFQDFIYVTPEATQELLPTISVWLDMLEEGGFSGFGDFDAPIYTEAMEDVAESGWEREAPKALDPRAPFTYQPQRCASCGKMLYEEDLVHFGPGVAMKCELCGPWSEGEWALEVDRQRLPQTKSERVSAAMQRTKERYSHQARSLTDERKFDPAAVARTVRQIAPKQRLTRELVMWARTEVAAGRTIKSVAEELDLPVPTVQNAVVGTRWADVTEVPPVPVEARRGGLLHQKHSPVLAKLLSSGLQPGQPFTSLEAAEVLGIDMRHARQSLNRLADEGRIERLSEGGPGQPAVWTLR